MRVVLDTNIFVSSFFGGLPKELIDLWKTGELTLCLSSPVVEEYIKVLQRMGLVDQPELEELLTLFRRGVHVLYAGKTPSLQVVRTDPDDDKFIECAVELHANCIVSGDRALVRVKDYMGIKILSPRQFLDLFRGQKG